MSKVVPSVDLEVGEGVVNLISGVSDLALVVSASSFDPSTNVVVGKTRVVVGSAV